MLFFSIIRIFTVHLITKMYTELKPGNLIAPYVEAYWIIDKIGETKDLQSILPDGCVDIIISLGDTSIDNGFEQNIPYVFGTHTTFSEAPGTGDIKMLGIRFKPAVFKLFTQTPISEFTNRKIDIFSFQSIFDHSFYSRIEKAIEDNLPMAAIIGNIEQFLISKLPVLPSIDKRIQHALSLISTYSGNLTIDKLSTECCLSERQLERRFKTEVGIGPKIFSRIFKFRETKNRLNSGTWSNLQELAWDSGYFDNAHMTKEFLKFSGTLPSDSVLWNVGFLQEP